MYSFVNALTNLEKIAHKENNDFKMENVEQQSFIFHLKKWEKIESYVECTFYTTMHD